MCQWRVIQTAFTFVPGLAGIAPPQTVGTAGASDGLNWEGTKGICVPTNRILKSNLWFLKVSLCFVSKLQYFISNVWVH